MKIQSVFAFLGGAGAFAAIMIFIFPGFLIAYLVMAVCVGLPWGIYAGLKERRAATSHKREGSDRQMETGDSAPPSLGAPSAQPAMVAIERAPEEEDDVWAEEPVPPVSNPFVDYLLDTLRKSKS